MAFFILATPLGCQKEEGSKVIIFAGSSMAAAMKTMETSFELENPTIDLELILAGSQTLAMQINAGAHADLFISANRDQINRIDGFNEPVILIENTILAITEHDGISNIKDAIDRSRRIIIAHKDVPAGRYTRDALEAMGLWELVESKTVSQEHSVRGVLTKIVSGQADLGFVYRTDALSIHDQPAQPNTIEFPPEIQSSTQTWITIRSDSSMKHSPAQIVYQYLTKSDQASTIFAEHGFTTPPSPTQSP